MKKQKKEKQKITEVFVIPQKKPKSYKVVNPAKNPDFYPKKTLKNQKLYLVTLNLVNGILPTNSLKN